MRAIFDDMKIDRDTSEKRERGSEGKRRRFRWILSVVLGVAIPGGGVATNEMLERDDERLEKVEGQVKNLAGTVYDTQKANSEGMMKLGEKLDAISPAAGAIEMPDSVKGMAEDVAEVERKRDIDALMNGGTE